MEKYVRREDAITGKLLDEMVMMDIREGKYFSLNSTATRIWEMIREPVTLDDLCSLLMEEYEIEEVRCKEELEEYLSEMSKLGLVKKIEF